MNRITIKNLLNTKRLAQASLSAVSRLWTRSSESYIRKVYKLKFCRDFMANGLLKKLALGTAITGSALLGARAASVEWSSFEDIVEKASTSTPAGQTVNYLANSITFKDQNGNVIANNPQFSLVYYANSTWNGISVSNPVGGLNGSGSSASGWFNQDDENYWGLTSGQTANTGNGNGYWVAFVDLNGDGNYGTYDSSTGLFIGDPNERISNVNVANFQAFQTGAGTLSAGDISGWYTTVPEPSTLALLGLGLGALGMRRKKLIGRAGNTNIYDDGSVESYSKLNR